MNDHDILSSVMKEKELLEKLSPNSHDMHDLDELIKDAKNPKVLALLMFKLIKEKGIC